MQCPLFVDQRHKMLSQLRDILAPRGSINLLRQLDENRLVEILLNGSSDLDITCNSNIFNAVHNFLTGTSRFKLNNDK